MAVLKLNYSFNMALFNSYDIPDDIAHRVYQSNSGFAVKDPSRDLTLTVTGNNLTYRNQWEVNGGTFQAFEIQEYGQKPFTAEGINSLADVDYFDTGFEGYYGLSGDLAYWMHGDDTIYDGNGNETIMAFAGNDLIIAAPGNDIVDGGQGSDTVQYAGNRQDFLVQKQGNNYAVTNDYFGSDTLINIEFLKFNDQTISVADAVQIQPQPQPQGPTEIFLQEKFQITLNDAQQWVIQHLDKPQEIYDICTGNGISSNMLAEIVQSHFSGSRLTGADVDAWFKSQGVGNSAEKPKNPTEDFLQQKFQITSNDALQWVIQHLDNPQAIYDVCANAGLNSQMLADIVQPHFASVTLTGAVVNDWFAEQGIAALA